MELISARIYSHNFSLKSIETDAIISNAITSLVGQHNIGARSLTTSIFV